MTDVGGVNDGSLAQSLGFRENKQIMRADERKTGNWSWRERSQTLAFRQYSLGVILTVFVRNACIRHDLNRMLSPLFAADFNQS